jgi:hypothetical protein
MKVNKNFPLYKKGDKIIVDPQEQGGATLVEVVSTWYPNKGEKFSEKREMQTLGYLNADSSGVFPQLTCKVLEGESFFKNNPTHSFRDTHILLQGWEYNKLNQK